MIASVDLATLMQDLDALAPLRWAADWDNVGLLLGDPSQQVTRVLLALDMTEDVLSEAETLSASLLVAYHPPWFRPTKRLVGPGGLWRAASLGLAVYSPHTALDVAEGGTNDVLAQAAQLGDVVPLVPLPPALQPPQGPPRGQGRLGTLPRPTSLTDLARALKGRLQAPATQTCAASASDRPLRRVALCAGAGGGLLDAALAAKADVFVTGELSHHDALKARRGGLDVVCLGHAGSEAQALPPLARALVARRSQLEVHVARTPAEIFAAV